MCLIHFFLFNFKFIVVRFFHISNKQTNLSLRVVIGVLDIFSYSFFSPLIYIQKHWEKSSFHPSRTLVWTLFTPTWLTMKTLDWCRWWWWWKKYHIRQTKIFECLIVFAVFCVYRCSVLYIFFRSSTIIISFWFSMILFGWMMMASAGWWWWWSQQNNNDDDISKTNGHWPPKPLSSLFATATNWCCTMLFFNFDYDDDYASTSMENSYQIEPMNMIRHRQIFISF